MDVRIGYVGIDNWQLFLDRWNGQWVAAQAAMWSRSLQLSLDSDMTDVLLDPGDVGTLCGGRPYRPDARKGSTGCTGRAGHGLDGAGSLP
ncbi:hypothetical protein PUR28_08190 [Streptomyces sp. BE308]|uniref:hypothetical protein n=1 Tax=Streptomyces sp. BE308 TaxID=3002529 RepID=UPI002E78C3AA|nr:hypothetical protein [Streptomyces sp. BE308]MEE1790754.1 hypothetical protein [Streptomyces sp. BE308]